MQVRRQSKTAEADLATESEGAKVQIELGAAEEQLKTLPAKRQRYTHQGENIGNGSHASSSLAELHLHGSRLGLANGKCPLCGSSVTEEDFRKHLHSIEAGLQGAAIRLAEARNELTAADEAERKKSQSIG